MIRATARSFLTSVLLLALSTLLSGAPGPSLLHGQTIALSDSMIVQPSPYRIGINFGSVNNHDSGQVLKNLFGALNVGFEPLYVNSIWVAEAAGTSASFVNPDQYDTPVTDQLAGSTYIIVESTTAAKGCSGTITGNTAGGNSVYTLGTPCAAATSVGDQMLVYYPQFPTPEATWESSKNNVWASASNGGTVTTDSITPYDGQQSILLNTAASSSANAEIDFYADGPNGRVLLNGTYTVSLAARRISGSAIPSISVGRIGGPTCNLTLSSITSDWAVYSNDSCNFSETAAGVSQGIKLGITQTGMGVNDFDDVSFLKTSGQNPANTTPFRDEVVTTIQSICGTTGPKCIIRNWLYQDAETFANWTLSTTAAAQAAPGYTESVSGSGTPRLQDYLALVQLVNGIPYLEVPSTFTTADASSLITYLASNWVGANKPFPEIYLTFCNECWNNGPSSGRTLPWRPNMPSIYYYDYAVRESDIYHAMRSNPSYSSAMHLGMDIQMGTQGQMAPTLNLMVANGGAPDYMELGPYTQSAVSNWQTTSALWSSAFEEPWGNVADPASASGYYQSVSYLQSLNLCGPSGNARCFVTNYEQNNSTVGTCGFGAAACTGGPNTAIDQIHADYITAGGGEGIVAPLQALLNLQQLGVRAQNVFSLTESLNYTLCGGGCPAGVASVAKLWGVVVDMGGVSSAADAAYFGGSYTPRPQLLGLQLANAAIIGPMFSCPASSPTYDWPGDPFNGPTHWLNNVPYLYSFCFKNEAGRRAMVLINTDLTKSYDVGFSGTNLPAGSVSVRTFSPPSVNALNETPTGVSGLVNVAMSVASSTLSNPSTVTLSPASVTEMEWDAAGEVPSLTFTPIADQSYGVAAFAVSAKSESTGAISYSVASGPATVAGNIVTVTGVGAVTLQAGQEASGDYAAATASTTFKVVAATPTLKPKPSKRHRDHLREFSVSSKDRLPSAHDVKLRSPGIR